MLIKADTDIPSLSSISSAYFLISGSTLTFTFALRTAILPPLPFSLLYIFVMQNAIHPLTLPSFPDYNYMIILQNYKFSYSNTALHQTIHERSQTTTSSPSASPSFPAGISTRQLHPFILNKTPEACPSSGSTTQPSIKLPRINRRTLLLL